jgi:uncharacterized sporulation protein YeaH/YhbH (DUF444 family)
MHIIDRRANPAQKSLGNRQRFLRRHRAEIQRAVTDSLLNRKIGDNNSGQNISIKGTEEPNFHLDPNTGSRDRVLPGNQHFTPGDKIPRSRQAGGKGAGGSGNSQGSDDFEFMLTREEFLQQFFDKLALPDMVKKQLEQVVESRPRRAGTSTTGSPQRLNVLATTRHALGRRIALGRPKAHEIAAAKEEAERFGENDATPEAAAARAKLELLQRRCKSIPWIDTTDVRFNRFERQPQPNSRAVMFCLMDVSYSMGEHEKTIAKAFFMLLNLFLEKHYERVDIVFIRHTELAKEVNEQEFFHSKETGGTVVSSALQEMKKIIAQRYPSNGWNIYAAQASDGDNAYGDGAACTRLMQEILPLCQYFAYVETGNKARGAETQLWETYKGLPDRRSFVMRRVNKLENVWPVFEELFKKRSATPKAAAAYDQPHPA